MSNQSALYEITTKMEKQDYKNFSYLIIFRNKLRTVLLIVLLGAAGAAVWAMIDAKFSVLKFLITWLALICTAFAALFLRVEYKAFNREGLIKAGLKGNRQYITFYENYLTASEDVVKETGKIKYERLFQVLEMEDYYIIYASESSASMIRKKDVDEEDRAGFQKFLKAKMGTRYKDLTGNR